MAREADSGGFVQTKVRRPSRHKREALVFAHLERVSKDLLIDHPDIVRELIGRNARPLSGKAVVKRAINGWWFWEIERSKGNWVRLTKVRRAGTPVYE